MISRLFCAEDSRSQIQSQTFKYLFTRHCCPISRRINEDDGVLSRRRSAISARIRWGMFGLESRLIDLQSQRMFSDQFVVGEAGLGMLADHVNVLEVTLDRVAFED